jgi:hypothetical protein
VGLGAHVAFAFDSERKLRRDLVRRGFHNQEGMVEWAQTARRLQMKPVYPCPS